MDAPSSTLDLWIRFSQAHETVSARLSARLEDRVQIPLVFYDVLARLMFAENNALRMQELAERMGSLSKSGLTRVCDRMQEAGLLERRTCPSDRRGVHAAMTDRGRELFSQAEPVFLEALEEMLAAPLGTAEQVVLREALGQIVASNGGHACWSPAGSAAPPARVPAS